MCGQKGILKGRGRFTCHNTHSPLFCPSLPFLLFLQLVALGQGLEIFLSYSSRIGAVVLWRMVWVKWTEFRGLTFTPQVSFIFSGQNDVWRIFGFCGCMVGFASKHGRKFLFYGMILSLERVWET